LATAPPDEKGCQHSVISHRFEKKPVNSSPHRMRAGRGKPEEKKTPPVQFPALDYNLKKTACNPRV
jgi:hypothetical protein